MRSDASLHVAQSLSVDVLVAGDREFAELELELESLPRVDRIHGAVEVEENIAAPSCDAIHIGVCGMDLALQGELGSRGFTDCAPVCVHELLEAGERLLVRKRQEVGIGLHRNVGSVEERCLPVKARHVGVLVIEHVQE